MTTRVLARLGALLLAAALPLTAALPAAATPPARLAQVGQLVLHSRTLDVAPSIDPKVLTSPCDRGEQLVSGGYGPNNASQPGSNTATVAYVVFSYPSDAAGVPTPDGGRPTAWSIGVVNETKTALRVQVTAACLTGDGITSSVSSATETHSENGFSLVTDCPSTTVRVAGGYRSEWNRRLGRAAITGNYPVPDGRWGIDAALLPGDPDIKPRATVTDFAVCLAGTVTVDGLSPTTLTLTNLKQVCTGGTEIFAATCVTPQTGSQRVVCAGDQVLTGGGYQVISGTMPGSYPVTTDTAMTGPAWVIAVNGTTPATQTTQTTQTTQIRVTPLCLVAVAVVVTTDAGGGGGGGGGTGGGGATAVDLTAAAIGGGAILVLLLVLLLLVQGARRSARRRRASTGPAPRDPPRHPITGTGLEVVVRAQRSSYRLGGFRETR